MSTKRRHFSGDQKAILKQYFVEKTALSDLTTPTLWFAQVKISSRRGNVAQPAQPEGTRNCPRGT